MNFQLSIKIYLNEEKKKIEQRVQDDKKRLRKIKTTLKKYEN